MAAIAVHLALLQGDLGKAKWALRKQGIDAEQEIEHVQGSGQEDERLMLARVWLAEGKDRAVLHLLDPVGVVAQQRNVFVIQALQASALFGLQEHQQAVQLLTATLNLSGAEGYLRTFLDLGEPLHKLVQRMERAGNAKGYAHHLLEAFGGSLDSPEPRGGLSEREYEGLHQGYCKVPLYR